MKKFLTILFFLLVSSFIMQAQQIDTIEYFFDTDPGIGHGKIITVSNNMTDADIAFDLGGLSTGIHTLFIRLKNSSDQWSSTYQNTFFIQNGIAGTAAIIAAEYYFDSDPGYGNGKQISLTSANLDSNLAFSITGLSAGLHTLFVRLKNNSNAWSSVYQGTVLVSNGAGNSTMITAVEYYFDTDPGYGKGTQMTFNNNMIDSVINFNITGLLPGIHTLCVRLKNSDNNWSFISQENFLVSDGTAGLAQVQELNYFIDSVTNRVTVPLAATALLDTTLSVSIADNNSDQRILGLQITNKDGRKGNAVLNNISLCNLLKPLGDFRTSRFGNSYSFVDAALWNTSKNISWQVNDITDSAYQNSAVFNYTMPPVFRGAKKIVQITGAGCRRDTVQEIVNTEIIEYVSPHIGSYGSDLVLNIFGAGLDTTATVFLQRKSTIVYPSDKSIFANKMLTLIFNFHDMQYEQIFPEVAHYYDLHIHFLNGYDTVLTSGVTIIDPSACSLARMDALNMNNRRKTCEYLQNYNNQDIMADLTGPEGIRTGVWNNYTLHLTNNGFNIAKEFPYWLMIPAQNDVEFDLNFIPPQPYGDSVSIDTLPPLYVTIDTLIGNTRYQYKLYGFYFPYLSPGETRNIDFKLRSVAGGSQDISYWVQKSMFGSPWDNNWFSCLWDASGYVPLVGCATGLFDFFRNKAGFDASYKTNMSKGALYEAMHASGVLIWNLAGVTVSCTGLKNAAGATKLSTATIKKIVKFEGKADKTIGTINNNALSKCKDLLEQGTAKVKKLIATFSFDPNSLTGNSQYDTGRHFIDNYSPQHYTVNFENKPSATAPARHVSITDTLDGNKINLNTFSFTGYGIGDSLYMVPQFRKQILQTTGIKNINNMQVQFIGNFDTLTGIVHIDFYSMDAAGIRPIPETSTDGFLPPNTDGISGAGYVQFQVYAKDLGTMDTFSNKATIIFDNNPPLATNQWINTIDTTAPTGSITQAIVINDSTARLFIQHNDIGSGFQYNTFFVKSAADSMFRSIANTSADTVLFVGTPGQTYRLFTKATDNVGNRQIKDSAADVTFALGAVLPLRLLSFNGKKEGSGIRLKWSAVSETNFSRYEVEKSADGLAFAALATINATGGQLNNDYQLYDDHPFAYNNYYRLKQVDKDNTFTYSRIIRIDIEKKYTLNISPQPAHNFVVISGAENFTLLQFIDISGKTVRQFTNLQNNQFDISNIDPGMYYIRLSSNKDIQILKLVIE